MQWKSLSGGGNLTIDSSPLGKGGEGAVYGVSSLSGEGLPDASSLVAKIYHEPNTGNRFQKVVAMMQSPPNSEYIAWPLAALFDDNNKFQGFLMKKLDYEFYRPWAEVSHASTRRVNAKNFDYRYALTAALNLSDLLESVHQAGHIVGDVNESNILVGGDATVFLVDTDSAQVVTPDGKKYRCEVGKPEYTAPELTRGAFRDQDRNTQTDLFAYSIAVWQIITGGTHPTDGKYVGEGDPPSITDRVRKGVYPAIYGNNKYPEYKPLPRVPSEAINPELRANILQALSVAPENRGNFNSYREAIEKELSILKSCDNVSTHWFSGLSCPWCARANAGLSDPWGEEAPANHTSQVSLPAINFSDQGNKPSAQRVRLNTAPNSSQVSPAVSSFSSALPPVSSTLPPVSSNTPAPPPEEEIPEKIKGKTVLISSNGDWGPRPPLTQLAQSNFKLAVSCFFNEIPTWIKFWYGGYSLSVPLWWSSLIGWVGGILISLLWLLLPELLQDWVKGMPLGSFIHQANLSQYYFYSSTITSAVFVSILFGSALIIFFKYRGKSVNAEKPLITISRFLLVSFFYGPVFVLLFFFFLVYLLILFIKSVFMAEHQSYYR